MCIDLDGKKFELSDHFGNVLTTSPKFRRRFWREKLPTGLFSRTNFGLLYHWFLFYLNIF